MATYRMLATAGGRKYGEVFEAGLDDIAVISGLVVEVVSTEVPEFVQAQAEKAPKAPKAPKAGKEATKEATKEDEDGERIVSDEPGEGSEEAETPGAGGTEEADS